MRIEVYQQDWIPGFAAFLDDGSIQSGTAAKIALNIGALMAAVDTKDLAPGDIPYVVAESIMHEVMHALEAWSGIDFSEARIESLLEKYRSGSVAQWTERVGSNVEDASSTLAVPANDETLNRVEIGLLIDGLSHLPQVMHYSESDGRRVHPRALMDKLLVIYSNAELTLRRPEGGGRVE